MLKIELSKANNAHMVILAGEEESPTYKNAQSLVVHMWDYYLTRQSWIFYPPLLSHDTLGTGDILYIVSPNGAHSRSLPLFIIKLGVWILLFH